MTAAAVHVGDMRMGVCPCCKVGVTFLLRDGMIHAVAGEAWSWRAYCDHEGCEAYMPPDQRTPEAWDARRRAKLAPGPVTDP